MLPPEREEEVELGRVNLASRLGGRQGRGNTNDRSCGRGTVGSNGVILGLPGVFNLMASPGRCPSGASLHDEGAPFQQADDVGTAELVTVVEAPRPVGAELEKDSAAAGGLDEGAGGR